MESLLNEMAHPLPQTFEGYLNAIGQTAENLFYEYDVDILEYYGHLVDADEYEDGEDNPEYIEDVNNIAYFELEDKYMDWLYKYDNLEEPLTVYRAVTLPEDPEKIDIDNEFKDHIGIYWTDSEKHAEPHWGRSGEEYVLRAVVNKNNIDWFETIRVNMHPNLGEEEQEITLHNGTTFRLTGIKKERENVWEPEDRIVKA